MTDIVERLRACRVQIADEAADEIERLHTLLQELIDIEGPQPGTANWAAKVRDALGIDEDDGDHRFNKKEYA